MGNAGGSAPSVTGRTDATDGKHCHLLLRLSLSHTHALALAHTCTHCREGVEFRCRALQLLQGSWRAGGCCWRWRGCLQALVEGQRTGDWLPRGEEVESSGAGGSCRWMLMEVAVLSKTALPICANLFFKYEHGTFLNEILRTDR